MLRLSIALIILITTVGYAGPIEDPDPEPFVAPKTVYAKLVAKKRTYKLDLGNRTKDEYIKAAKDGSAAAIPVEMELVITNGTKKDARVRVSGAVPRMMLKLEGGGAVSAAQEEGMAKGLLRYEVLKPGQKVSIPITSLVTQAGQGVKTKGQTRLYWTEPGSYKVTASFYTSLDLDYDASAKAKLTYTTLTAKPITLTVEK